MSRIVKMDFAINEIARAVTPEDTINPFYFIVGAGISSPVIPTATKIINECKTLTKDTYDNRNEFIGSEEYSTWLQRALPHSKSRREYFRKLIENKPITNANFKLAHLLSKGGIGKVVITPNFDNFLSRALTLFNSNPMICDHPGTAFKIDAELDEIQLVHIHGNYLSYDCCNLTIEISDRTEATQMSSMLERIGGSRSPIIVGYSGWEDDIIMNYLKRRLNEPSLPYNLYWFCYKEESINSMPEWLKAHNNVVFVVSNESLKNIDDELKPPIESKNFLPAEVVFESMIQKLELTEPEITKDPLNFLTNLIKGTEDAEENNDVFFLSHVVHRLKELQLLEDRVNSNKVDYSKVQTLRSLVVSSQYETSLKLLGSLQIDINELEEYQKVELIEVLVALIVKSRPSEEIIIASDLNYEVYESLSDENFKEKLCLKVATCLLKKAFTLEELERYEETIDTLNGILDSLKQKDSTSFKLLFLDSLSLKAQVLAEIEQTYKAIDCLEESILRYENESSSEFQKRIAYLLVQKARLFEQIKEIDLAKNEIDRFLLKFNNSQNEDIQIVTLIILNQYIFIGLHNEEDEKNILVIYNKLYDLYSISKNPVFKAYFIHCSFYIGRTYYFNDEEIKAKKYLEMVINNDLKTDFINEDMQGDAYAMLGLILYQENDIQGSYNMFELGYRNNNSHSTVNLGYMIRRKDVHKESQEYDLESLFDIGIEDGIAIAYVNKALYLVNDSWNYDKWVQADKLIESLNKYQPDELDGIISWWHKLALNGETEGDLVLGWLVRHNLITDPDGFSLKDRFDNASANARWYVQNFLYEKVAKVNA
ncbi:SIR2 family protein [Bacillus alkalisoli]|uniref:SIR2 family protein n=1 Tax=Bacillus alkalisoli TaxID=2011008 RepID=UPI000C23DAEE|nr:SIR2 family protein [Bacillus alkalisoli]